MFARAKTVSSERNVYIMKATGIVRRIDDLGRVVIPKEIRRTMRIREGTPLEIYTSVDGEVIFRKYSPVGEISGTAGQYADVLYKVGGMPTVICDRDHVIAASGIQKKEVLERRVSSSLEDLIEQRKSLYRTADGVKMNPIEGVDRFAETRSLITSSFPCACAIFVPGTIARNVIMAAVATAVTRLNILFLIADTSFFRSCLSASHIHDNHCQNYDQEDHSGKCPEGSLDFCL